MTYDVVIRGGTVIDGSGLPRYRADVGLHRGRIARIGRIRESATTVVMGNCGFTLAPCPDGERHNGEVVVREGEHTGAFPDRLLRGPLARR